MRHAFIPSLDWSRRTSRLHPYEKATLAINLTFLQTPIPLWIFPYSVFPALGRPLADSMKLLISFPTNEFQLLISMNTRPPDPAEVC